MAFFKFRKFIMINLFPPLFFEKNNHLKLRHKLDTLRHKLDKIKKVQKNQWKIFTHRPLRTDSFALLRSLG